MSQRYQLFMSLFLLWGVAQPNALADETAAKQPLTFDAVYGELAKINPFGRPAPRYSWRPDGNSLLRNTHGKLTKIDAATGDESAFYDSAVLAASLEKLREVDAALAQTMARLSGAKYNSAHDAALITHANDLYVCKLDGSFSCRLTKSPQIKEELATFSPDGKFVAYVCKNDLYVSVVATQTERRLTHDGDDLIRNGKADWVYYEELFERNYRAFWFSGDGKQIAFMRFDDTPVGEFVIPNNVPVIQKIERTRYPQAGTPNPLVTVGVADVEKTSVKWIDLSAYPPTDRLIVRIGWLPDHQTLYLEVQNRIQTWLDFLLLKPDQSLPEKLLQQTTPAWVNPPEPPRFLKDGSFLLTDEATGWRHISRYTACGKLQETVTSGEWAVDEIQHVDETGGWVYFTGTKEEPLEKHLYRAPLNPGEPQQLTTQPGTHRIRFAPSGKYYLDA